MTDNITTAGSAPEKKKGFFATLSDIEFWAKVSEIAGLVMCFVSACFTVRLMRSFATDGTEYWLYTVYGATVQVSQNCLFVYSVFLHRTGQGFKAMTAFVLFCLLFVLSLAGTMGSFIVSNKVQNNQELTQDTRLKDMQARAKSLDRQIEASQRLISSYASKKIMTKGAIPEGQRLDTLNAERNKLSEDMANYKTEGTSDALHIALGKMFDCDPEDAKIALFTLYAIALDLVSAVMLAYSLGLLSSVPKTVSEPVKEAARQPETSPNPVIITKTAPAMQVANMTPETAQTPNFEDDVSYTVRTGERIPKQPIGFTAKAESKTGLSFETVKAYLETAYKGQDRPKSLLGRRSVADRIGINNETSDHIHAMLKRRKIVSIRGNRTIPEMTLTEAMTALA